MQPTRGGVLLIRLIDKTYLQITTKSEGDNLSDKVGMPVKQGFMPTNV